MAIKVAALKIGIGREEYMCTPIDELAEILNVHNKIFNGGGGEAIAENITEDTAFFPIRR